MKKRRILVVDDQRDCADSLADLLRIMGHEARAAYEGHAALAVAKSFQPEIILLDLGMPILDGFAVARALRAGGADCAIAAVTGYGQPQDVERCLGEGFDFHILKPAAPADLRWLIDSVEQRAGCC